MPDTFDVVVAGGGHNALVAAAYLTKAGFECCVLDSRPILGGDTDRARTLLEGAVDQKDPDAKVVRTLGKMYFDAGEMKPVTVNGTSVGNKTADSNGCIRVTIRVLPGPQLSVDDPVVVRVLRMEELDGHPGADDRVLAHVDRAHAALAEQLHHPVGADGAAEQVVRAAFAGEAHSVLRAMQDLVVVRGVAVRTGARHESPATS